MRKEMFLKALWMGRRADIHSNNRGFAQSASKLHFLSSLQTPGHFPYVYKQILD